MKKYDDFLAEQLQDEELKKEYDNLQPEFDVIRAIVDARVSQNLTQRQLAERSELIRRISVSWKMGLEIHLLIC